MFGHILSKMKNPSESKPCGLKLRELRTNAKLSLREVANELGIDTSLLAKIERNERLPSKDVIKRLASYYRLEEGELSKDFASDQIAYKILAEDLNVEVLSAAEEKVAYLKNATL